MLTTSLTIFLSLFAIFSVPVNCGLDDLENFINPEDLDVIYNRFSEKPTTMPPSTASENVGVILNRFGETPDDDLDPIIPILKNLTEGTDCFGLGGITAKLPWIFNLRPQKSHELDVSFFLTNRKHNSSVQMFNDEQFCLECTYFDPKKNTVFIVHGFLSYGDADWVKNMTTALLQWDDVNVITVDWSKGGNTWKYWRAVANTRTVGADLAKFTSRLINSTGSNLKQFHFIGHSLGAHICSYASLLLGKVRRITGLDPAQPCFQTSDLNMLLDETDADFVDIIHTNARNISKYGLGMQTTCGHQDFYPNGGMKQPGCYRGGRSILRKIMPVTKSKIERMICNHGRAYLLFTESLKKKPCKFNGHKWDRTYASINESINRACGKENCVEMGIDAEKYPARGSFYVMTTAKEPYCDVVHEKSAALETRNFLLTDIIKWKCKNKTATTSDESQTPRIKKGWFFGFGK